MKTLSFIFCFLFLVSCGKKNTSGSRPSNFIDPYQTQAEITSVTNTRNGVMVQGTQANFAIPVVNVTNIYKSKNLVGVIYNNSGLRTKIYNALGTEIFGESIVMRDPRLNIGDDVAAIDYIDSRGNNRVVAVNVVGRVLLQLTAEAVRAKADYGVVAITYRTTTSERAIAMKASGEILLPDDRNYIQPRFTIDPYVLIFRHAQGQEQIAH